MKDSNIVKIAIKMTDQQPQLIEFNQKQPLAGIIQVKINLSHHYQSKSHQFRLVEYSKTDNYDS